MTLEAFAFPVSSVLGKGPGPWKPLMRSMGRPLGEMKAMVGRDWTPYLEAISAERLPASVSILTAMKSAVTSRVTSGSR